MSPSSPVKNKVMNRLFYCGVSRFLACFASAFGIWHGYTVDSESLLRILIYMAYRNHQHEA